MLELVGCDQEPGQHQQRLQSELIGLKAAIAHIGGPGGSGGSATGRSIVSGTHRQSPGRSPKRSPSPLRRSPHTTGNLKGGDIYYASCALDFDQRTLTPLPFCCNTIGLLPYPLPVSARFKPPRISQDFHFWIVTSCFNLNDCARSTIYVRVCVRAFSNSIDIRE